MFQRHSVDNYMGNPKLKAIGQKVPYTREHLEMYGRAATDMVYFAENFTKIQTVDEGLVNFNPRDYQKTMMDNILKNRFTISLLPRQTGKSTTMAAISLWFTLFNPEFKVAFLANKDDVAKEQLKKIKRMYEELPLWIQQGVTEYNKHTIAFENGSSITVAPTSSSAIRGFTFNFLVLDEFAWVPFNIQQEFLASVYPTISSGKTTRIAMISTPNGMELFHKFWKDATTKTNSYVPLRVRWNEIPGRDEAFKERTIANVGERIWRVEFACEFLGSQDTLIDPNILTTLAHSHPLGEHKNFSIYGNPEEGHIYVALVDTAEGLGKDYSTVQIVDVTTIPYEQVAVFRNNKISTGLFPGVAIELAWRYNQASTLVETNDIGGQVALTMEKDDRGCDMLLYTVLKGTTQILSGGFGPSKKYPGLKMTKTTKSSGCSSLKTVIESKQLIIHDYNTIQELSVFVQHGNGTFSAREGHHDDLVMPLVLFGWLVYQPYFTDITNTDFIRKLKTTLTDGETDEFYPFGLVITGDDYDMEGFGTENFEEEHPHSEEVEEDLFDGF